MLRDNGNYWESQVSDGFLLDKRNGANHPERQFVKEWVKKNYPNKSPKVIDIPCGIGSDLDTFEGCAVMAIDKTEKCLELLKFSLKPEQNVTTSLADIRSIPMEDAQADIVYARAIFEHLPSMDDVALAMKECVRLTKKHVIFSFYLPFGSHRVIDNGTFFENTYSREAIIQAINESGVSRFETVSIPKDEEYDGEYTLFICEVSPAPTVDTPKEVVSEPEKADEVAEPAKPKRGRKKKEV